MHNWEKKLKTSFGSAVVNKRDALNNQIQNLPRYVSEYMLGVFCEEGIEEKGIKEMHEYLEEHLIEPKERERFKFKLKNRNELKIIDRFKVRINLKSNKQGTNMDIPSLGISNAESDESLLSEFPRLMIDGLWGMGKITYFEYDSRVILREFKPFQLSDIDLEEYIKVREYFTTDEWLNALISTIGLDFSQYDRRQKFILLSRLIPMVENNIFMMEFGSPGTGKTYAYENLSSHSRVISGSKITASQLFYNLGTKQDGLIVQYDVLLFDEIDKVKSTGLGDGVTNVLYNYLQSGKFDRGDIEKTSECGIMMVGNIPNGILDKKNLLNNLLHSSNKTSAFLDRIAGIVPGWEISPIKDPRIAYTKNYGFSADYFSEILHKLRRKNYHSILGEYIIEGASIRDKNAVERIAKGLIKLIYPDNKLTPAELKEVLNYAIEYRQFILEQIYTISRDHSFSRKLKLSQLTEKMPFQIDLL